MIGEMRQDRARRIASFAFWLALALATGAAITWFSSQPAAQSDGVSTGFAQRILELLRIEYTPELLRRCNRFARKAAHFTIYFVLGFSLTGCLRHQRKLPAVPAAAALGAAFAALDELHQSFVPGRGSQLSDVLLDACGVAAGSLLAAGLARLLGRMARPPARGCTVSGRRIGRNEPCPCGSGKKFKRCCGR